MKSLLFAFFFAACVLMMLTVLCRADNFFKREVPRLEGRSEEQLAKEL